MSVGIGDWDVVDRTDIPSPGKIDPLSGNDRLVSKLTDKLSSLLTLTSGESSYYI